MVPQPPFTSLWWWWWWCWDGGIEIRVICFHPEMRMICNDFGMLRWWHHCFHVTLASTLIWEWFASTVRWEWFASTMIWVWFWMTLECWDGGITASMPPLDEMRWFTSTLIMRWDWCASTLRMRMICFYPENEMRLICFHPQLRLICFQPAMRMICNDLGMLRWWHHCFHPGPHSSSLPHTTIRYILIYTFSTFSHFDVLLLLVM